MNKPDFAELKEKLTKLDDVAANAYLTRYMEGGYVEPTYQEYGEYIHAKSAAIITELLEIIQSQSEALGFYASDSSWNSVGAFFYNRIDSIDESTIEGLDRHTYFGGKTSRQALSETNTRLQKLREGTI